MMTDQTWTCSHCGADGNKGHACRKCITSKPAAPKPQTTFTPPSCLYCGKACGEKVRERQTIFGVMRQTLTFCYHCNSWQV